jgi:hypothetical protein
MEDQNLLLGILTQSEEKEKTKLISLEMNITALGRYLTIVFLLHSTIPILP